MMIPTFFLLLAGASVAPYVWFSSLADPRLWKRAFHLSLGIGIIRTVSAVLGEVILANQSNWLQIPAYGMALARLPEAAFPPEAARSSHTVTRRGSGYGLGVWTGTADGRRVAWHAGSTAGFAADARHYPDDGISIAMLVNADSGRMGSEPQLIRKAVLNAVPAKQVAGPRGAQRPAGMRQP